MKNCFLVISLVGCLQIQAQEICSNGRDDDGDNKIDLRDEDCTCTGSFVKIKEQSLIPNHSFEDYRCCPQNFDGMPCVKNWIQPADGTSDYVNLCGFYKGDLSKNVPPAPLPFPDGAGAVGFIDGQYEEGSTYKEYVATRLLQPLKAGTDYLLDFYLGFGFDAGKLPPIELTIYGSTSPDALPFQRPSAVCPSALNSEWFILGSIQVGGSNQWVKGTISFKPVDNITSLAIGPPCQNAPVERRYYYLDKLELYRKEDAGNIWLNVSASPECENSVTIRSNADDLGMRYQWFKDGIALPGAVRDSIVLSGQKTDNGKYQLMISSGNACQLSTPYDYVYTHKDVNWAELGLDIIGCPGQTLILSSPVNSIERNGRYYHWSDGSTNEQLSVTKSGTYWLDMDVVDITNGSFLCRTSDTVIVNLDGNKIELGPEQFICPQQDLQIGREIAGAAHRWNTGANTAMITVNQPGKYTDSIALPGCIVEASVVISNNPLDINLGADIEVCTGEHVVLKPEVPPGTQLLWNFEDTHSSYTTDHSETVILEATLQGCVQKDTIALTFKPVPFIDLGNDTVLCENSTIVLDATVPGGNYHWYNGSSQPTVTVNRNGLYSVRVSLANKCYKDDSIFIRMESLPIIELGKDLELCRGSTLKIVPQTIHANTFIWNDGVTSAIRNITIPGTYELSVGNHCGITTDRIEIVDRPICTMIFPNAFTPNRDGRNDVFKAKHAEGLSHYFLKIYNRWGQVIYESQDTSAGWDGTWNQQKTPAGAYMWRSGHLSPLSGKMVFENGTVLLIR